MAFYQQFIYKSNGQALTSMADFINAAPGTEFEKHTGEVYVKTNISNNIFDKVNRKILSKTEIDANYGGLSSINTWSRENTFNGTINSNNYISFEGGKHWITTNDGKGNFNLRIAHNRSELCTEDGYAFHMEYVQGTGEWQFNISNSFLTLNSPITWNKPLSLNPNGASINGNLSVTGSLTTSGTINGRNIASDGTTLDNHINNTNNPHNVTASQIGAATTTALNNHINNTNNPHNVTASQIGAATTTALNNHINNTNNPHNVTASQIGAVPSGNALIANAGKAVQLPRNTNLETWANTLPNSGLYAVHLTTAQGNLPSGWWYIELLRHYNDTNANLYHVMRATALNPQNIQNSVYMNTCMNGVWGGWVRQDIGAVNSQALGGLGVGQTWVDVTANRAYNTVYTNTTGKPICVVVTAYLNTTSYFNGTTTVVADYSGSITAVINGSQVTFASLSLLGSVTKVLSLTGSVIVPKDATYKINRSYGNNFSWHELR